MSMSIAPSMARSIVAASDGTESQQAALPPALRDAQGREYRLQIDPSSGLPQYRHASEQRDATGSLSIEIVITLAPDGSFTRRTSQDLQLASGDGRRETVLARHAADGTQTGERVESFTRRGSRTTDEKTEGTYVAGTLVRRETDLHQREEATNPTSGEATSVEARIRGVWDEGGMPITDQTVPHVDRTETQRVSSPGQGINKDTPRTLTFTARGAGPLGALTYEDHGTLVVRFAGRKGQYIERELRVPLDAATGAPRMDQAEVTRTDDKQNLVNKGLMQARIWGGLASNVSWIIGVNFVRGGMGRGLLAASAAAAGAQLTGEVHAVATKRNDGDWSRVVRSGYDALLVGLLAAYRSGRPRLSLDSTPQLMALNGVGAAGLAMNGSELLGGRDQLGADRLTASLRDTRLGAGLSTPEPASPLDGDWRMEPRFDAARVLLG
jgi:hypothetical protein